MRGLLLVFFCCVVAVSTLKHPGVLIGQAQLDFIKSQVAAKTEPFHTAYNKAVSSSSGSRSYSPKGPPASKVIECGAYSNPNHGCSDDDDDGTAAYVQSLLWYISSDDTYLKNTIKLLNAYTSLQKYNNSNAPLQAAWSSLKWTRAAEIVKYTSTTWTEATAFQNMLNKVHLPLIQNGSPSNGNWELSMIEGILGIAVFSDNQALFDHGVTLWNQRVPAYFYLSAEDGNHPKPAPRGNADWYGQTTFNKSVDGIAQETCRDLGHTQFGLSSALNAASTAATQGTDLFGAQSARLIAGMEFNANLLNGVAPPRYVCDGKVDISNKYPTFEIGYNHYHNKGGAAMPHSLQYITNHVRTASDLTDYHIVVWETLTNAGSP